MRRRLISTTRPSISISLFAEPATAPRAPSSFALSIFAHGLIAAALYFGFVHAPAIKDPSLFQHYDVRQLDMHPLDPNFPNTPAEAKRQIPYPHYDPESGGGLPLDLKDATRTFLSSAAGRQTIVQPEVRTHVQLAQPVPLPSVMIWSPGPMPAKKIVAPQPNLDTSSYVTPSLELPAEEIKLADVSVASTDRLPRINAMPASTTSPIETPTVKPVQKPLITMSKSGEQPTPAAVLSVSNIRMEEGTLFVPPVNDIAKSTSTSPTARPTVGTGSGSGSGAGTTGSGEGDAATLSDAESVTADGRRLSSEHIVLPRDGKFSVVVVGSSLGDDYPEMPDLWGSRVAYTAYLHVGLKKNWVLQYSATRAADVAGAGRVARIEAPWPYDIKRPNLLTKDLNADALMVHGILNQAGRLESLAIVFPSGFRYTSYVLYALRQWQFRPARQDGQATPVEVLLVIPDQLD